MTGLLPSDNAWDVPSLRLDVQPTSVPPPVVAWGSVARTSLMSGTWHFYTTDDRFSALLSTPVSLLATGCTAACEPNITIHEQDPRWKVIHAIGRKRVCARTWQDLGVPVFVDLNVPMRFRDIALAGVPRGYRAYATRGYAARPDDLLAEYELACDHARGVPLVLVVGGGRATEALCRTLPGAVYVPDFAGTRRASIGCSDNRERCSE